MFYQYLLVASNAAIALAMAVGVFCLGNICARRVWARTKKKMDLDPYSNAVFVPFATNTESILIFLAVMLRSPYMLMLAIHRELKMESWERSKGVRELDLYSRTADDLLGSVSNMLSGFPERATSFYVRQSANSRAREYATMVKILEHAKISDEATQAAIG